MHYQDGTEALKGDIAKGRGYNLPYEIVGPVVQIIDNQETCNLRIQVMVSKWHEYYSDGDGGTDSPAHFTYELFEEAGQTNQFTLVHRRGWTHTPLVLPNGQTYGYIWLRDGAEHYLDNKPRRIV